MGRFDAFEDRRRVLKPLVLRRHDQRDQRQLGIFLNSACTAGERGIQLCSTPLKRKKERTFTE
jgi:hypothetical protein